MNHVIVYHHQPLNQEIQAIGGSYILMKEVRLPLDNREVLYQVGCAMVDRSCCGTGGCGYAVVQGVIRKWQFRQDGNGLPVSEVERIEDEREEQRLRDIIRMKEGVQQVNFL